MVALVGQQAVVALVKLPRAILQLPHLRSQILELRVSASLLATLHLLLAEAV
jgi:hypothetical protein